MSAKEKIAIKKEQFSIVQKICLHNIQGYCYAKDYEENECILSNCVYFEDVEQNKHIIKKICVSCGHEFGTNSKDIDKCPFCLKGNATIEPFPKSQSCNRQQYYENKIKESNSIRIGKPISFSEIDETISQDLKQFENEKKRGQS